MAISKLLFALRRPLSTLFRRQLVLPVVTSHPIDTADEVVEEKASRSDEKRCFAHVVPNLGSGSNKPQYVEVGCYLARSPDIAALMVGRRLIAKAGPDTARVVVMLRERSRKDAVPMKTKSIYKYEVTQSKLKEPVRGPHGCVIIGKYTFKRIQYPDQ